MSTSLLMFVVFILITLGITYWASRRTGTTTEFYSAGRRITGFQNGWAVAGDYMSAASFLGIAGLIAFYGYDGFMYSVGWLVAYLTVLLLVAEPLRNTGRFTMADVLAFRLRRPVVRVVAAMSTLTVSLFYMIAQMVGAGSLVSLLVPGIGFNTAIVGVGALMLIYVIFGGMLATTWVQIVKAVLLMSGTILLSVLVLARFHFSVFEFFDAVSRVTGTFCADGGAVRFDACPDGSFAIVRDFTQPGLYYHGRWGALSLMSLGIALIFGTAGLPHILVRFYTVPSAQAARTSVVWAMILIGSFYVMTTFLGFGAATLVGKANIGVMGGGRLVLNQNLAAPLLAREVGGDVLLSFVSAIAFATILAVVAGLTISASVAFAHDIWFTVVKRQQEDERLQLLVARITAGVIGVVAIVLAIALRSLNVAFLVGLAFAVAASANVPAILLTLYWRRFNTTGMIAGMLVGLLSAVVLIVLSPAVMGIDAAGVAARHLIQRPPIFPLDNPAIVSVPLGFLAAVAGTLMGRDPVSEAAYSELNVRANTGLGAL
jgi:cation/acetate symporter